VVVSKETPVCCYSLQGTCFFGADNCEYSHDASLVGSRGCQFGTRCRLGHWTPAEAPGQLASPPGGGGVNGDDAAGLGGAGLPDVLRAEGGLPLLECRGPAHDDSDPLWEELACTMRENSEDVGDADLSVAARRRLAAEGLYQLVDDDTADEWLCIPAEELRGRLEAAAEKVARSRRLWFTDDLREASCHWNGILGVLRPGADCTEGGPKPAEGGALQHALELVDAALQRVLSLHKDKDVASQGSPELFLAAQNVVSRLRRGTGNAAARLLSGMTFPGEDSYGNAVDEDDLRFNLEELQGCLERCLFVVRAEEGRAARASDGEEVGGGGEAALAVGASVEVSGLTSAAEQGLNGQEGLLERYDEALGLWQVRLAASGTRLLLGEGRVSGQKRPDALPRVRSRSPRKVGAARSVLELAQEAAKSGAYVLIHHTVAWTGLDAKLGSL